MYVYNKRKPTVSIEFFKQNTTMKTVKYFLYDVLIINKAEMELDFNTVVGKCLLNVIFSSIYQIKKYHFKMLDKFSEC